MGDLSWTRRGLFTFPQKALHLHATALGSSGSGKTETLLRAAYGAHNVYRQQVVYLDAKGETKREDEQGQDNAARFVATMTAAGAKSIQVFPSTYYNGWHGTPAELKNRLLSVIDFSESAFYGDVAANALDLALGAPTTPRSSTHFLANLRHERLKAIYKDDALQYRRVLALDKHLLQQVEMRYQVFFSAMAGQLDGTLDYANADAVYLRVRGFALRNEAPRLGRFFVADFMHYMAERRRAGVQTLFIIDEFNALRMREETSILFEQIRSFGGNLIISAQGYAGLGPHEYAERILDACSTYILHTCSDPGPISRRAGKKLFFDVSWSEDEEGNARKHIRPRWDWRVPESAVMQQEEGQAFWISRARAQHVQTAMVPITPEQVREAWNEIHRMEELQHARLELEEQRRQEKEVPSVTKGVSGKPAVPMASTDPAQQSQPDGTQKKRGIPIPGASKRRLRADQNDTTVPVGNEAAPEPAAPSLPMPPIAVDQDDDGPDRL
jgi:hypothetical protein